MLTVSSRERRIGKEFDPNQPRDAEGKWVALIGYKAAGYANINPKLRSGVQLEDRDATTVSSIDSLMKPAPRAMTVYRGSVGNFHKKAITTDMAFSSTSKSLSVALGAAEEENEGGDRGEVHLIRIDIPKGHPIIDYGKTINSSIDKEKEVILSRGTKFRKVKSGTKTINGVKYPYTHLAVVRPRGIKKDYDPNQRRDRLGRWWDGVPRAYGTYDANSSGKATGNDIAGIGSRHRRSNVGRVKTTTTGAKSVPSKPTARQVRAATQWSRDNLDKKFWNYADKFLKTLKTGKSQDATERAKVAARQKVDISELIVVENRLIDAMFSIEKRFIEFTKHGTHDQSTHGNRYGGALWGYSRSGSTDMTARSAQYMGIDGYKTYTTEQDTEFVNLSRRGALGILKSIKRSAPTKLTLVHGEVSSDERLSRFKVGKIVRLPLTATSPVSRDGTNILGEAYAHKKIDQSGNQVIIEFLPGTKAHKYDSGEYITAGDFVVKAIRNGIPKGVFDYQNQVEVESPVTHIVLEQVEVFDPDRIMKANPLWDGDGVQGVGQPRGAHGRWTDNPARAVGAVAARQGRALRSLSTSTGAGPWNHKNKSLAAGIKLTRLPHGGQHAIEVNGKKVARKNLTPEQALYQRNNGPTKITNARLAQIHKDRSKITPGERDLLMSAGAQAHLDGDDDVKVWVVRDKAFKPRPRYSIIANLRKEIANDVARNSGDTGEGSTKHVTRRTDRTAAQRAAENQKRVESGRNSYARIRKDMVEQFSSDGGKTVKCIFCGKPVAASVASPERMKPGPIGGTYEIGNVAPAHERCNTVAGQVAQYEPEQYYDEMMLKFMEMYIKMTPEQKKKMQPIFTKNRKKLGARPR